MFYLLLAIATSAMISSIMRLSETKIKHNMAMLAVSYLTSTLLASVHLDPGTLCADPSDLLSTGAMALINGALYVGGFVLMQRNIPRHGVVLTSTYMRLGLVVCLVLSQILFRESPTWLQLIGFGLALGAIVLNGGKGSGSWFRPGLLWMLVLGGVGDTWVKVFGTFFDQKLSDSFLVFTFVVAALLCLGMMVHKKQRIGLWELIFGAAIAIPNYYNSRFLLKSLQSLPGILVYPTFSVGTLLLITILGVCLFKERLTRRQWVAMAIILVALALLNL